MRTSSAFAPTATPRAPWRIQHAPSADRPHHAERAEGATRNRRRSRRQDPGDRAHGNVADAGDTRAPWTEGRDGAHARSWYWSAQGASTRATPARAIARRIEARRAGGTHP